MFDKLLEGYGSSRRFGIVHLECVRYCFLPMINKKLYRVIQHWNEHTIRRNSNADCPSEKPDVMYLQPEIYPTRDFKMP